MTLNISLSLTISPLTLVSLLSVWGGLVMQNAA